MQKSAEKPVILDNKEFSIVDPVYGSLKFWVKYEKNIIDHPLFQSLHCRHQLPFLSLTFRGSTHSRFIHSLGTCHMSDLIFQRIMRMMSNSFCDKHVRVLQTHVSLLRVAALLSDIADPPFAPVFLETTLYSSVEKQIKENRETYIREILNDCLPQNKLGDIEDVLYIIDPVKYHPKSNNLYYLHQILNCEIGANKIDYLGRDSYFAGVKYGNIDMRIIDGFTLWLDEDMSQWRLAVKRRWIENVIDFFSRETNMDNMIYNHKTRKAAILQMYHHIKQRYDDKDFDVKELVSKKTERGFLQYLDGRRGKKYSEKLSKRILLKPLYVLEKSDIRSIPNNKFELINEFRDTIDQIWEVAAEDIDKHKIIRGIKDKETRVYIDPFMFVKGTSRDKERKQSLSILYDDGTTKPLNDLPLLDEWYKFHQSRLWKLIIFYNAEKLPGQCPPELQKIYHKIQRKALEKVCKQMFNCFRVGYTRLEPKLKNEYLSSLYGILNSKDVIDGAKESKIRTLIREVMKQDNIYKTFRILIEDFSGRATRKELAPKINVTEQTIGGHCKVLEEKFKLITVEKAPKRGQGAPPRYFVVRAEIMDVYEKMKLEKET